MDFKEFDLRDFPNSFIAVTKAVLLRPGEFFRVMPTEGGFGPPVAYLGICFAIWALLRSLILLNPLFILLGIISFFFSFLGAGILQLVLKKFFGARGNYEATFRVVAYSGAVNLLSWIPFLGFLASLYGLWLKIVGLEAVHGVTKLKAFLAVLISAVIFILITLPIGGFVFLWA
ncbi:MAG: hypothetical protein DRG31_04295 [Deltaproteobacteria bacterium]|nr:MAG: hypothetical protein DRG31_04295 [Deltaproteobacteria bacterium]